MLHKTFFGSEQLAVTCAQCMLGIGKWLVSDEENSRDIERRDIILYRY